MGSVLAALFLFVGNDLLALLDGKADDVPVATVLLADTLAVAGVIAGLVADLKLLLGTLLDLLGPILGGSRKSEEQSNDHPTHVNLVEGQALLS